MKMTLLDMVQRILFQADSDNVNSITDSIEAEQAASVIRDIYEANIATKKYKEIEGMFVLESVSNSLYPNYLRIPDNIYGIRWFQYNKSTNSKQEYRPISWVEPHDFINRVSFADELSVTIDLIYELSSGTPLLIQNDKMPDFYTSFDGKHLVFNSYDSDVETTLQGSKSRVLAKKLRTFTMSDTFTPELNEWEFPGLLAEAKSTFMSLFKGVVDPKIEQMARRQNAYRQNEERLRTGSDIPNYGRS